MRRARSATSAAWFCGPLIKVLTTLADRAEKRRIKPPGQMSKLGVFLMYGAVLAGGGRGGPQASAVRPGAGPACKRIFGLP